MIPISISPNIDRAPWEDARGITELGTITRIGRLPRGTTGGKSTVTIMVEYPDGRRVMGQTTLALLSGAMRALKASAEGDGEECF